MTVAPALTGVELVQAVEEHCLYAWPAAVLETTSEGWALRATPGLEGRGRSNHALTPAHPLSLEGYERGLAEVVAFASEHGIARGVQVSPLSSHALLLSELNARGWVRKQPVVVMAGDATQIGGGVSDAGPSGPGSAARGSGRDLELTVADSPTPEWVSSWQHCDPRADGDAHVETVFQRMAGTARFAHAPGRAVGISVELEGIVGLYCIAVAPEWRRRGLGKSLVRGMLAEHTAPLAYLQVFSANAPGIALYRSLGFREQYRYCHAVLPPADPRTPPAAQPPPVAAAADLPWGERCGWAAWSGSRRDALPRVGAIGVRGLELLVELYDHSDSSIKPEEANAIGPMFNLVWQRQPAVVQERQHPALRELSTIDRLHASSMRLRSCPNKTHS